MTFTSKLGRQTWFVAGEGYEREAVQCKIFIIIPHFLKMHFHWGNVLKYCDINLICLSFVEDPGPVGTQIWFPLEKSITRDLLAFL